MFSWYKYLIVNLVFSHLGFWSGNLFLIVPFPDICLLVLSIDKEFKHNVINIQSCEIMELVSLKLDVAALFLRLSRSLLSLDHYPFTIIKPQRANLRC